MDDDVALLLSIGRPEAHKEYQEVDVDEAGSRQFLFERR